VRVANRFEPFSILFVEFLRYSHPRLPQFQAYRLRMPEPDAFWPFGSENFMQENIKKTRRTPSQSRPTAGRTLLLAGVCIVAVIAIVWLFMGSERPQQPGEIPTANSSTPSEEGTAVTPDAETIDVDQVTDTADIPTEDADPNPVVPQDALIPPAPVDDAPPD
jgi:hypothetical protein